MAPAGLDEACLLHARELGGQGAAIGSEIISKLLPVEGDVEFVSTCLLGDVGEARQHLAAKRSALTRSPDSMPSVCHLMSS